MKIKETSLFIKQGECSQFPIDTIILPVKHSEDSSENAFCSISGGEKIAKIVSVGIRNESGQITQSSLRIALSNALEQIERSSCHSIGIAPLLNDPLSIPPIGEAKIIIQEILKWLKTRKSCIQEIFICLPSQELYDVFNHTISGYVTHLQDTLGDGPYVTVDIIIELPEGIILIERSNPPYGWALPGGFVDYGETLEVAAVREAKEETNMDLENLKQFHAYSDPNRDPRFHTVSTVFIAQGKGTPEFGDDAKGLKIVKYEQLLDKEYAFDHKKIIQDYLDQKVNQKG